MRERVYFLALRFVLVLLVAVLPVSLRAKSHGIDLPIDPQRPTAQVPDSRVQEERERCQKAWNDWVSKHGGATPYMAENKGNQLAPFQKRILNQIREGKAQFTYKDQNGDDVSFDLREEAEDIEKQLADIQRQYVGTEIPTDRHALNTAYLLLLSRNNPNSNLMVVNTGAKHVRDFYFENPTEPVAYLSKNLDKGKIHFTPEFYDFLNLMRIDLYKAFADSQRMKPIIDRVLNAYFLGFKTMYQVDTDVKKPLLSISAVDSAFAFQQEALADLYLQYRKGRMPSLGELLAEPNANARVFIHQDYHILNDHSSVAELPAASCLKVLGIQSVSFVFEALQHSSKGYTFEDAMRYFNYADRLKNEGKIQTSPDSEPISLLEFARRVSPKAYELLQTGRVQLVPGDFIALRRAQTLQKAGMKVNIQGLELNSDGTGALSATEFVPLLREWYGLSSRLKGMNDAAIRTGSSNALWGSSTISDRMRTLETKLIELDPLLRKEQ